MKKILPILTLVLFVIFIIGCKNLMLEDEGPKSGVEVAEEDIEKDISEIDTLEEDLDMSELDELDALIEELEFD